jgi:hypothetical protein
VAIDDWIPNPIIIVTQNRIFVFFF